VIYLVRIVQVLCLHNVQAAKQGIMLAIQEDVVVITVMIVVLLNV
jgi:hypothetical protein